MTRRLLRTRRAVDASIAPGHAFDAARNAQVSCGASQIGQAWRGGGDFGGEVLCRDDC